MNERMNELAGQAKFMAEETINRQISYNAELKAFAEKFAELIVKECLHIVDDEGAGEGGCIRAMIRIQEEFGVEE